MRNILILLSSLLLSFNIFATGVNSFYQSAKLYEASEISLTAIEHLIPTRARILVSYKGAQIGIIDPSGIKGNDYCREFVSYFEGDSEKKTDLKVTFRINYNLTSNYEGESLPVISGFKSLYME